MNKEIEIPEGYEARIVGNKVVFISKESEEEKIREEIITYLRSCHEPYMKEWISYLEKQKEQKPIEWSEKDEKMLIGVVERGNSEIPRGECGLTPNQVAWLETRFNSLRPHLHWKPSEEQMKALRIAYEIGTANESWAMGVLKNLYTDLKKL